MAMWDLRAAQQRPVDLAAYATSQPGRTAVVASATPHAKGAWTEVVASTSAEWAGFQLTANGRAAAATDTSSLLDIGIGGAGSEVVVLADLPVGYTGGTHAFIPLRVPAGVRVAMRRQDAVASNSTAYGVVPFAGAGFAQSPLSFQTATTYGTDAAASQGVDVPWGGSNNTFGAWTEIAASTTRPIAALLVGVQAAGDTEIQGFWLAEVGFGAAGSEVSVGFLCNGTSVSESMSVLTGNSLPTPALLPTACNIPAGSRLVARMMSSSSLLAAVDVTLIGLA